MGLYDTIGWNNYNYCSQCGQYYYGFHACTLPAVYYPNYTCFGCGQHVTYNGHVCSFTNNPQQVKPKYDEHTLDCGCKVKTVVVDHCGTVHPKPPETEEE